MSILRVPVTSDDHIQGPDNAPVTLLEYGDYECPHCGRAHSIVQQVQRYFGSRLRFVYRHFPLTEIHQFAEPAAETAEYAAFHGRFWEAHDMLFETGTSWVCLCFSQLCDTLGCPSGGFATLLRTALSPIRCGAISSAAYAVE